MDFTFDIPAGVAASSATHHRHRRNHGANIAASVREHLQALNEADVTAKVVEVFRRHGAINLRTPLLAPKPSPAQRSIMDRLRAAASDDLPAGAAPSLLSSISLGYMAKTPSNASEAPPSMARLLDASGTVVHLPMDLREPFARYVSRQHVAHVKR